MAAAGKIRVSYWVEWNVHAEEAFYKSQRSTTGMNPNDFKVLNHLNGLDHPNDPRI